MLTLNISDVQNDNALHIPSFFPSSVDIISILLDKIMFYIFNNYFASLYLSAEY